DDRGRADPLDGAGDSLPIVVPSGRRDDEPAHAGGEGDREVRSHGFGARRVDDDVAARDRRELVPAGRRAATNRDDVAAFAKADGDRLPQGAVAEDRDGRHVLLLVDEEPPVGWRPGIKKPRSPGGVRGPWSLRARRLLSVV